MNSPASIAPYSTRSMPEPSKAELLRALGRVIRGLSALFWGLPLAMIVYVQTARTDWLDALGLLAMVPSLLVTVALFYGLSLMHSFQKQERIWIRALDRAQFFAFVNLGLCPFLYWWHILPYVRVYELAVGILVLSSILFLFNLNYVLQRLTAMLPDEGLRIETKMFTGFNRSLLVAMPVLYLFYILLGELDSRHALPDFLGRMLDNASQVGIWLMLFLLLMPTAMTMTLIWKIKEVIFNSVFEAGDR